MEQFGKSHCWDLGLWGYGWSLPYKRGRKQSTKLIAPFSLCFFEIENPCDDSVGDLDHFFLIVIAN